MQPWEKEKSYNSSENKKEKRSVREKIGLVTNAVVLSVVACTFIYGSVIYGCFKENIYKVDPKLKK